MRSSVSFDATAQVQQQTVRVVGGGLAGCECAYQLAKRGYLVELIEMKPHKRTPAQTSDHLAELVCSNSLRSNAIENAVGLLKEEMRRVGGFVIACADEAKVPAGDALAVDRTIFAALVEKRLREHANISIKHEEYTQLPDDNIPTIIATGPLTSDALATEIVKALGKERLAFYDAISPIIEADSVDMEHAFFLSRYGKGEGTDYLNCPMDDEEFSVFYQALTEADRTTAKEFEDLHYFEGCLPLEVMAERGEQTMLFGPLKPVGLEHPVTGKRYRAVLQLRKEDVHGSAYNLVGCQTRLKQGAQKAVFGCIPALKNARFLRYGAIHRNTYIDSPACLDERVAFPHKNIFFAGQITGVEGYVESMACGIIVANIVDQTLQQKNGGTVIPPPSTTMLGALYHHVRGTWRAEIHGDKQRFQPSNITWAMVPPVPPVVVLPNGKKRKIGKDEKRTLLVERSLKDLALWLENPQYQDTFIQEQQQKKQQSVQHDENQAENQEASV